MSQRQKSAENSDPRSEARGLYRPAYERDSCGFGLIASLDDHASHWVVETAISSLNRLTHRGATAADGKTGDGCGLLIKTPQRFLRAVAQDCGLSLSPLFAAGLVFLDRDPAKADHARRVLIRQIEQEKLQVAGFIDNTHSPLAEFLEDFIVRNGFPDQVRVLHEKGTDAIECQRH